MSNRSFDYTRAARLYKNGWLVSEIAEGLGVSVTSVRRALELEGVDLDPKRIEQANKARRVMHPEEIDDIERYRREGHSWREIGTFMGVPFTTVKHSYDRAMAERANASGS